MIPGIFPLLAAASSVTDLLGTDPVRVFPFGEAPERTALPYVTYGVVSGDPQNQMDKVPSVDVIATQVDIWAETAQSAWNASIAIRDVIEPKAHMTAFASPARDPETRRYRVRLEFDFFTER